MRFVACILGLSTATLALAQDVVPAQTAPADIVPAPVVAPVAEPEVSAEVPSKREAAASPGDEPLQWSGRVVGRMQLVKADGAATTGQLTLQQARLGAEYDGKRVRAKVSIELAGKASVRDAVAMLRVGKKMWLWAGRAKVPMSAVEQPSTWTLPGIDRPAGSDILRGLGIVGRFEGLGLEWKRRGWIVEASLHQSVNTLGDAFARPVSEGAGLAVTARAARRINHATIGVGVQSRETNYSSGVQRYWAAAIDGVLSCERLRVWGDAVVGSSHLGVVTEGDASTLFALGQAVAAIRFDHGPYWEPFVHGAVINPSLSRTGDWVLEGAAGLNVGTKRWRAQLGITLREAHSARPAGLGGAGVDINDAVLITTQLGAKF